VQVDLVPREVVADWLKYLRAYHPTIAFKASTQGSGKLQQVNSQSLSWCLLVNLIIAAVCYCIECVVP
jgi:hypothetical protein